MERRALGRTGLAIGRVGLGTVKLGRNQGVKYPEAFELPTDAEVERLLESALDAGVNLFDTAPAYGRSEERLAPFVRRHRDRIVLCTKVGETFGPDGSHHDFSGPALRASLEASLRRLDTDTVDLLLLHSDGRDRELLTTGDTLEALLTARGDGLARAVGISAKTAEGIRLGAQHLDVVMAPYSLHQDDLAGPLAEAAALGCGILTIKALASGHLAVEGSARDAFRHVLSRPWVDGVVVGTLRFEHLEDALIAAREAAA